MASKGFCAWSKYFLNYRVCSAVTVATFTALYIKESQVKCKLPFKYAVADVVVKPQNSLSATLTEVPTEKLRIRELQFVRFASVEYNGELYMTPRDFLDSVVYVISKQRKKYKKVLTDEQYKQMMSKTPSKWYSSDHLFRKIDESGIISYSDYLFLLSIMTQPISGFNIAFKMLDIDGSGFIDLNEFLVLNKVFLSKYSVENDAFSNEKAQNDANVFSTTILIHLFGKDGKEKLAFKDYCKFLHNLQSEVLQVEYQAIKSSPLTDKISESDFARLLLKFSRIDASKHQEIIERIEETSTHTKGISLEEFRDFFQLLNNIEDFSVAMKMYSMAQKSISKVEFQQSVKACLGFTLADNVVDTIFLLFDADGDGSLSYKEFVDMLQDRLSRGISRDTRRHSRFKQFKRCVIDTQRS